MSSPFQPLPSASTDLASQTPSEIHLYDYLEVLLRRRVTFLVTFLVVFLGVAVFTMTMKPVYEAFTTLHIKSSETGKGPLSSIINTDYDPVDAQLEILKSRTNAEQVVKRLHMHWRVSDKSNGLSFKLLQFESTASRPAYRVKLTGPDAFTVTNEDGRLVGQGQNGRLMQGDGIVLFLDGLRGRGGDSFRLALVPATDIADSLRLGIQAAPLGKGSGVVRVAYGHNDPEFARDVVNTLVQVYQEQALSLRTQEAGKTVAFLDDQLGQLRIELERSEKNLEAYKKSAGLIDLSSEAQEMIGKVSAAEKAKAEVVLQEKQLGFAISALKETIRNREAYSPAMRNDPVVAALADKLTDLETQKQVLLTKYTDAHPAVKALLVQIDEIKKKILATYEDSLVTLGKKKDIIDSQLASYDAQFRTLPTTERELASLTRVSKAASDMYAFLLQKHEESRIAKASASTNIDVIDPAIVPKVPIKPKKPLNLALGFLVGAMLGIILAFFREYLDDTIKDADQAKRAMGLPLLATIPHIPGREAVASAPDEVTLITQLEPKSMVAEAFRSLRTSLHFSAINREKKIMLVTSTFPGEGKSIISANLAGIISQTGARVLIVDCDLRRPSLHEKFGHSKAPGLSEILTGDVTFQEARHDPGIQNLDLITAGTTPPNPSELLGSEPMRRFLLACKEEYDHIVIDAPPILAVTDAPVLTSVVDLVILIMEAGRVPIKVAQHMRETLANLQAPVAGIVMNDKSGKGQSYGYYGSRYYRYGKSYSSYGYGYYSDDERSKPRKRKSWKKLLSFWKKK